MLNKIILHLINYVGIIKKRNYIYLTIFNFENTMKLLIFLFINF